MRNKRKLLCLFFFLGVLTVCAQCRYCKSYKDFQEGRWETLDTIYSDNLLKPENTKAKKTEKAKKDKMLKAEPSVYIMFTNDAETTQMLRNDAFAIMRGDTLYVNCINIYIPQIQLQPGYIRAKYMGHLGLLIAAPGIAEMAGVHDYYDDDKAAKAANTAAVVGTLVGLTSFALGGPGFVVVPVPARKYSKQLVCYLISDDKNDKGGMRIRQVDDHLMSLILFNNEELYEKFFSVKNVKNRLYAEHVFSVLNKMNPYKPVPQAVE